jgi:hypothetical protein
VLEIPKYYTHGLRIHNPQPAVIFTPYIIIAFLVIVFASMVFLYMRNAKIADEEQSSCLDLGHGQEDLEMRNFLIDANRGEEGAHAAVLCEITPTPGSHDADQLKSEVRVVKPPAPAYFEKGTTTRGREFV